MKILEYKKTEITNSYTLETPLLIFLKELSLIIVEGENSFKFLQGQFTINMLDLSENKYLFGAHCNYIGKVLSIFIVFRYLHGYAYIQRSSVSEFHIQEIKKYAIFSNIDIYQNNKYYLFGVIGSQSRSALKKIFRCLPNKENNLVQERLGLYILRIEQPLERFIIVISLDNWNILKKKIYNYFKVGEEVQWTSLDIEVGFPIIDINCVNTFIPQEVNLMQFKAINFKKGCYQGQEIIAKTKFKNINRKNMYLLIGKSERLPLSGEVIEMKYKNFWKKIGQVLISVRKTKEEIWIQSILRSNLLYTNVFRVEKDPNRLLYIDKNFSYTNK